MVGTDESTELWRHPSYGGTPKDTYLDGQFKKEKDRQRQVDRDSD